jgi:hypothetical protein
MNKRMLPNLGNLRHRALGVGLNSGSDGSLPLPRSLQPSSMLFAPSSEALLSDLILWDIPEREPTDLPQPVSYGYTVARVLYRALRMPASELQDVIRSNLVADNADVTIYTLWWTVQAVTSNDVAQAVAAPAMLEAALASNLAVFGRTDGDRAGFRLAVEYMTDYVTTIYPGSVVTLPGFL